MRPVSGLNSFDADNNHVKLELKGLNEWKTGLPLLELRPVKITPTRENKAGEKPTRTHTLLISPMVWRHHRKKKTQQKARLKDGERQTSTECALLFEGNSDDL